LDSVTEFVFAVLNKGLEGPWGGERKVKAGTCRVRLEPTLLHFKSAAQLQYLPENLS